MGTLPVTSQCPRSHPPDELKVKRVGKTATHADVLWLLNVLLYLNGHYFQYPKLLKLKVYFPTVLLAGKAWFIGKSNHYESLNRPLIPPCAGHTKVLHNGHKHNIQCLNIDKSRNEKVV